MPYTHTDINNTEKPNIFTTIFANNKKNAKNGEYAINTLFGYETANYLNGKLHGKYEFKDNNKNIREISYYVKGKLHGTHSTYYENGQIKIQCEYFNGHVVGNYKKWLINGILCENKNYVVRGGKTYTENLMKIPETIIPDQNECIQQLINSIPYFM